MKRCLVIFPVGAETPEWFYQPMLVTDGSGPVTHRAALMLGEVPPHRGRQVEVLPSDTIKSALARVGLTRATPTIQDRAVRVPGEPKPAPKPGVWSRVKKFFKRG